MTGYKSISVLFLSAAMASPAAAAPGRVPITAAQIASTISDAGLKVSPQQITLLATVVATTSNPALKVESIERWGDERMKVRLDCASSEECLPFLVAVQLSGENASQAALAVADRSSTAVGRPRHVSQAYVVHAGSPAILLLEGNHVHIQLAVICLENGAAGQTVRVSSKDRQLTFSAEAVDGTTLKGRL